MYGVTDLGEGFENYRGKVLYVCLGHVPYSRANVPPTSRTYAGAFVATPKTDRKQDMPD